jgi:hypothetical protein
MSSEEFMNWFMKSKYAKQISTIVDEAFDEWGKLLESSVYVEDKVKEPTK